MITVSHEYPPNWETLKQHFQVEWGRTVVTYGDTIHSKHPISDSLFAHEAVHVRQQTSGHIDYVKSKKRCVEDWWNRYITDIEFRISQEVEAYREQIKFLRKNIRDRNKFHKEKEKLVRDLSGPMYGNVITYQEALRRLS